jgi:hypothetical protein
VPEPFAAARVRRSPFRGLARAELSVTEKRCSRASSGQARITRGYRDHSFTSHFSANNAVAVSAVVTLRLAAYSSRQSESRAHSWPGHFDIEIDYVAAV